MHFTLHTVIKDKRKTSSQEKREKVSPRRNCRLAAAEQTPLEQRLTKSPGSLNDIETVESSVLRVLNRPCPPVTPYTLLVFHGSSRRQRRLEQERSTRGEGTRSLGDRSKPSQDGNSAPRFFVPSAIFARTLVALPAL